MTISKKYFLFFTLSITIIGVFHSCYKIPDEVDAIIQSAGPNRVELNKVLDHYKHNDKDRKKFQAALFLIKHMKDKKGYYLPDSSAFYPLLNRVDSLNRSGASDDQINAFIDSKKRTIKNPGEAFGYKVYKDIYVVNADYLINNIDLAFEAWKNNPWSQHVNFEDFKEYILPHRVSTEPIEYWRRFFIEKFSWLKDSMSDPTSASEAALHISETIANDYQFSDKLGFVPQLGAKASWKYKCGICDHRYTLIVLALRAMGIPSAIDYTKYYGREAGSHNWTVVFDKDNRLTTFNGGEIDAKMYYPPKCPIGVEYVTTVYRNTYSENNNALAGKLNNKQLPQNFRSIYETDVTHEYTGVPQVDLTFDVNPSSYSQADGIFLFVFGMGTSLTAVDYTVVKDNQATFKNVGREAIYLPGYYYDGNIELAGNPMLVPPDSGEIIPITPDRNTPTKSVRLYRKHGVKYIMDLFVGGMIDAKVQGANNRDFSDSVTIFKVDSAVNHYKTFKLNPQHAFRYYRYLGGDTAIRIADISLYHKNASGVKTRLDGQAFGKITDENTQDDAIYKHAFDYDIRTNFNAPAGSWVALDLNRKVKLSHISLLARNNQNIVEPGDLYQLLYFDNGWRSIGKKQAHGYFVEFDNVPDRSILLLRNKSKGKEERIFLYENNKQVFW